MKFNTKRIAICGLLVATALVLNFVEKLIHIDFLGYGLKLGFANIVVIFALYKLRFIDSFIICILKILICGLGFGGPVYLMYSLCGGLLSYFVMCLAKTKLNIITVSCLGSVFFNVGQILCACLMLSTKAVLSYLPVLIIIGLFTGALIGVVSNTAIKRIKI